MARNVEIDDEPAILQAIGDYLEHFGYDDTSPKTQTREQFEVPASSLSEYETVPIDIERGDMCFFDRNLLHASTINESDKFSYDKIKSIAYVTGNVTIVDIKNNEKQM